MKPTTEKNYQLSIDRFIAWCGRHSIDPLDASARDIVAYLHERIGATIRSGAALGKEIAAINHYLVPLGCDLPVTRSNTVREFSRRFSGMKAIRKAIPLQDFELGEMLKACPPTLIGKRDRALLTFAAVSGWSATRITGLTVAAYRSLGSPEPAVDVWLAASGITDGPVFRAVLKGDRIQDEPLISCMVKKVAQRRASQVGIDPRSVSALSLRKLRKLRAHEAAVLRQAA